MKTVAVNSPFQDCGLAIALVTNLGVYAGIALCFAAAVYWLMQPTVIGNPGLTAYKPLPGTVVIHASSTWAPSGPPELPAQFVAEEPATEVVESAAIAPKLETRKNEARARATSRRERRGLGGSIQAYGVLRQVRLLDTALGSNTMRTRQLNGNTVARPAETKPLTGTTSMTTQIAILPLREGQTSFS